MTNKRASMPAQVVALEVLKDDRFSFVEDLVLRENLAMNMQYIVFLMSLEKVHDMPGSVRCSLFKTVIVFAASIIEALIHEKIRILIKSGSISEDEILGKEYVLSLAARFHRISEHEEVRGIKRTTKQRKLSQSASFAELNRIAKKSGLFTNPIWKKSEQIREFRNRIHPYTLKEVDDRYTKEDLKKIFAMAKVIIQRIETYRVVGSCYS